MLFDLKDSEETTRLPASAVDSNVYCADEYDNDIELPLDEHKKKIKLFYENNKKVLAQIRGLGAWNFEK